MSRSPTDQPTVSDRPRRADHGKLAPGDTVGRYELVEKLGSGGMGVVFRARDPQLGRSIAIKVVLDPTPERAQRLIREAQAMAQVSHSNLVVVHDAGTDGSNVFLAMELVEGISLRRYLSEPAHGWRAKLASVIAAGRGLAAAHAVGIVHRDFKPENVLVDRDGHIKVADFGLARALEPPTPFVIPEAPADLTVTGSVMGTPAYMASEQYAGKLADARSDQFALAVTAWEAVWSERPFRGEYLALAEAIKGGKIGRPEVVRGVPTELESILRRALDADPEKRFPTVPALLDAIEHACRPPRRWPLGVLAGVLVVVCGGVFAWQQGVFQSRSPIPSDAIPIVAEPRDPITSATIEQIIREHGHEVTACFDEAKPAQRSGSVELGFEVAADGHVRRVEIIVDDFAGSSVGRCAAAAALGWEFPPGTRADVTVPFRLRAR